MSQKERKSQRHRRSHLSNSCKVSEIPLSRNPHHFHPSRSSPSAIWSPCKMLGPLLYLSALIAGVFSERISGNTEYNISSCPIAYYQNTSTSIYLNFTADHFVICFNGFYDPNANQDCIIGPDPQDDVVDLVFYPADTAYEATIQQAVPTILNKMTCSIKFNMTVNGTSSVLTLASFNLQASLELFTEAQNTVNADIVVNGGLVESLPASNTNPKLYTDISGCRISGGGLKPQTSTYSSASCTNTSCSSNSSLTYTGCDDQQRCDGTGVCLTAQTCTVTGPAIIDVHGAYNSVGDRCVYTLVSDSWILGLLIFARFRERRYTDVSFVDSVTLRLTNSSTDIRLGQGGEVLVNGVRQTLNSTAQEIQGVMLSMDQTGVQAQMIHSGRFLSLFFDDNMVQIYMEGPAGLSLDGLCDSSGFTLSKLNDESDLGCDTNYTDPADRSIHCQSMSERCSLLRGPSFLACNMVLDPASYITACNETMCKYPSDDGHRCEFIWAYARACSIKGVNLGDWLSETGCSPPEAICQDKFCSDHEFCGIKYSGEPGCLCRAIFASSYRESNTLSNPTVCALGSASVSVVGCLLEENNIDYSTLHLNDESCRGEMDEESHMVTFSFNNSNTCGAVITTNNSKIIYSNTIKNEDYSYVILRSDGLTIDFSCVHAESEVNTMSFRILDNCVMQQLTAGHSECNVTMKAYTDVDRTQLIGSTTEMRLDQRLWIRMESSCLDIPDARMVIDSCWATNEMAFNSSTRHDLVVDGCANTADSTVTVTENGVGTVCNFRFNTFQFTGSTGDVYLHCKLYMCIDGDSCKPSCSAARRRRSVHPNYDPEASALITMALIN